MGVTLLGAGMIFFLAYNWNELGRYAKFALAEAPILAVLVLVWRLGVDSIAGKASLLLASLLVGGLLALVGQTYQTGADTFELFAAWAAAILPWVLVARFGALWVAWLALLNVAVALYFFTMGWLWGLLFAPDRMFWVLFGLNTAALVAWEGLAAAGVDWLRERWSARIIATASGGFITALGLYDILEWRESSHWGVPLWLAWIAAAYYIYRHWMRDLYVLAAGVLSVIAMATTSLAKQMPRSDAGTFLLLGLLVIAISAAGGYWLKRVAAEEGA